MNAGRRVWGRHETAVLRLSSQRRQMVFGTALGLAWNLLFALYHGVLGVTGGSLWLTAMCAYYTVLSVLRSSAVIWAVKRGTPASGRGACAVLDLSGWLLVVLSVVLAGVVHISLRQETAVKRDEILMITIAAYTFGKLGAAGRQALRQRGGADPLPAVLCRIRYAEAAASVLTLQRSMLASFGAMSAPAVRMMNQLTGSAVCVFVLLMGAAMIRRGRRSAYGKIKIDQGQRGAGGDCCGSV